MQYKNNIRLYYIWPEGFAIICLYKNDNIYMTSNNMSSISI